jgi:hypothetical protein
MRLTLHGAHVRQSPTTRGNDVRAILLASVAVFLTAQCQAADFQTIQKDNVRIVRITGDIVPGDYNLFQVAVAGTSTRVLVSLASRGGNPVEAINIGTYIRNHKFSTYIRADKTCASSCALIWLAGTPRSVEPGARIGFHGVYFVDDGSATPAGNAWVGAYLGWLGFSYVAIRYFTEAPSDSMQWLTEEKAKELNLEFRWAHTQSQPQPPFVKPQTTTTPAPDGWVPSDGWVPAYIKSKKTTPEEFCADFGKQAIRRWGKFTSCESTGNKSTDQISYYTPSGTDCRSLGYSYWSKTRARCE